MIDTDRVWLITGSSTGFGRALAEAVLEHGYRVVATARKPEQLKELSDRYPDRVTTIALDVADTQSVQQAVEGASEALAQEVKPLGINVTIIEPGAFRTHFNGRSIATPEHPIQDYAQTSGEFIQWIQETDGQQPGDPAKAAQAMIQVVESDNPPLRLALGEDAVNGITQKLESMKAELEAWKDVSINTAFEDAKVGAIRG